MVKDYILSNIFKGIANTLKPISQEAKFAKDKVLLNSLTREEQLELVELIVDTQSLCVRKAITQKEEIKLDYIGSFKVSELRDYYLKFEKQTKTDNPNIDENEFESLRKQAIQRFYDNKLKFDKSVVHRRNENS